MNMTDKEQSFLCEVYAEIICDTEYAIQHAPGDMAKAHLKKLEKQLEAMAEEVK